jgi:hypothetical protein
MPGAGGVHDRCAVGGVDERLVFLVPADAEMNVTRPAKDLDDLPASRRMPAGDRHLEPVAQASLAVVDATVLHERIRAPLSARHVRVRHKPAAVNY